MCVGGDVARRYIVADCLPGRLFQGLALRRQQCGKGRAHVLHVHQVGSVGIQEFPEGCQLGPQAHHAGQVAFDLPGQGRAERVGRVHHRRHFFRADHRHGGGAGIASPGILRDISVCHAHGNAPGRYGRILHDGFDPFVIVQPRSADQLLAHDRVVRITAQVVAQVHAVHQAAVEGDDVHLRPVQSLLQARAQLRQGKAVVVEVLVVAQAEHRPAAVVPEYQDIPLRRSRGDGVAEEIAQRARVAHVAFPGVFQQFRSAVPEPVVLHAPRGKAEPLPFLAAAGGDDRGHRAGTSDPGGQHLPDIRAGLALVAFQVRTADVCQDGHLVHLRLRLRNPGKNGGAGQHRRNQEHG